MIQTNNNFSLYHGQVALWLFACAGVILDDSSWWRHPVDQLRLSMWSGDLNGNYSTP